MIEDIEWRRYQIRNELIHDITHPDEKWYVQSKHNNKDKAVKHPECPYAYGSTGFVPEHRYVWWLHHKEDPLLKEGDIIHHINGDHQDNRIENLALVTGKEHRKLHGKTISESKRLSKNKRKRKYRRHKPI